MVRQYFITSYYVTAHHRIVGSWMSKKWLIFNVVCSIVHFVCSIVYFVCSIVYLMIFSSLQKYICGIQRVIFTVLNKNNPYFLTNQNVPSTLNYPCSHLKLSFVVLLPVKTYIGCVMLCYDVLCCVQLCCVVSGCVMICCVPL